MGAEAIKLQQGDPRQMDMFADDIKNVAREKAEKEFRTQQKMEDRPLPKYHRMPSVGTAKGALGSVGPKNLGGKTPEMRKGGSVSSASKRADGIAQRGKTRGRMV